MKSACAIHLYVACLNTYCYFNYTINSTIFRKDLPNMKYVFGIILINKYKNILILRGTARYIIQYVYWYSRKVPVIFAYRDETLSFLKDFRTILKNQISGRYNRWEHICFMEQTDGQTERKNYEFNSRLSKLFDRVLKDDSISCQSDWIPPSLSSRGRTSNTFSWMAIRNTVYSLTSKLIQFLMYLFWNYMSVHCSSPL